MSLKNLLKHKKRSEKSGGIPSLVNIIDRQVLIESRKVSDRNTLIAACRELLAALLDGKPISDINEVFDYLSELMAHSQPRDVDNIHPSELLGACNRALYYRLKKVPRSNTSSRIDAKTMRIFDLGSMVHKYIQTLLLRAGVLKKAEVGFFNAKLRLIGHADGLLYFSISNGEGIRAILEIKTINSFGFQKLMKQGKPNDYHVYQASIYAKELNADTIVFLYFNKDTSDIIDFVVHKKDFAEYQQDAYDKVQRINDAVDNDLIPPRICKDATDSVALECVYCNHCFNLTNMLNKVRPNKQLPLGILITIQ